MLVQWQSSSLQNCLWGFESLTPCHPSGKRHDPEDPNYAVDLEKYVFNKKEVKNVVMEYVVKSVLSDADNLVVEYAERIKGDELRDVDESDI